MKLNDKQLTFAREYCIDLNATQAAIRAGYSEKTAGAIGAENLQKPQIRAEIEKLQARRIQKLNLSAELVLENLMRIAAAAESAEDFNAALRGNELLGKHLKLFTDKTEVSGEGGAPLAPPVFQINFVKSRREK